PRRGSVRRSRTQRTDGADDGGAGTGHQPLPPRADPAPRPGAGPGLRRDPSGERQLLVRADDVVRLLDLKPHPEGGWYRETFRDQGQPRARSTAIYYLLARGQRSHWHRVDAAEVWHHYAGAPLNLELADDSGRRTVRLGSDLTAGEAPQGIAPAGAWQAAETL